MQNIVGKCRGLLSLGLGLLIGASHAQSQDIDERTRELRTIYNYLYQENVVDHPDGRKTFHNGTLFNRDGVNVLHLKGDSFEMAFQHGRLLKEEIDVGAVRISARTLENRVRETIGNFPLIVRIATNSYHRRYTDEILRWALNYANESGAENALDELIGVSEASGIGTDELIKALLLPEVLMVIAKDTVDSKSQPMSDDVLSNVPIRGPAGQCSDFLAWGDYTTDGSLIIGRNTDYAVNGYYDRFPTVIYFEPSEGQRYMTVASAGIHNAGLVSLNESGLFLGVHTIPTTKVSKQGIPVFMTASRIMKNATTYDQALEIFGSTPTPGGWTYTMASVQERKYGSVEIHNGGISHRPAAGGVHIQANRYMTDEFLNDELFFNKSIDDDSDARYARMHEMLSAARGSVDAQKAMAIMGDHTDPIAGVVRGFPNTVSVHTTVTSAIVEPEKNRIFVANGMAPVSETTYVELPTINAFDPATFQSTSYQTHRNDGFARQYPEMAAAQQKYIEAKSAYEQRFDLRTSIAKMNEVLELDSGNSAYRFVLAIVYLRNGQFVSGKAQLQAMLSMPGISPQKELLARYYLGRINAHNNQRNAARNDLSYVVDHARDEKLRSAATSAYNAMRGSGRALQLEAKSLMIMFQQADVLEY